MAAPASEPLRILQIEIFGRGGLAHYAHNLARALIERRHEVTLVTAAGYELEGRGDRPAALEVVPTLARASRRFEGRLPSFVLTLIRKAEAIVDAFRVARLARRLAPQIVHLHSTNPIALLYTALLRRAGRTLVVTAHVVTPHEPLRFERTIYGWIHRLADLVIAHSEFDRRRLLSELAVDSERVVVIPHGEYGFFAGGGVPHGRSDTEAGDRTTARHSLGLSSSDEVALFFGYIREYKGLDVLLEAWPAVTESRPRARLVVAGDPVRLASERRQQLERWTTSLGAIHHFGYVPFVDVARYFAAADLLVMPYRHISQSGVLYLALSLGVPVVATRVGTLPEMLADGDSALLVAPGSPDELASALSRALGDASLRRRLARGGRRIAAEHSWPAIAERTERAFERTAAAQREVI